LGAATNPVVTLIFAMVLSPIAELVGFYPQGLRKNRPWTEKINLAESSF